MIDNENNWISKSLCEKRSICTIPLIIRFVLKSKFPFLNKTNFFLDSERSEECIDFTMMCILNEVMNHITSRNNAAISNFGGGFR
ncbi:Uncharacterized protein FWK35_00014501, partial [Aphis craccivora]